METERRRIGARIREIRLGMRQTQTALARAAELAPPSISRFESGVNQPTASTLGRIARALDVSTDYLTGLTDDPTGATERSDAVRHVNVLEVEAAAGTGATVYSEKPVGRVPFRRAWLRRRGLIPARCEVIQVFGGSMQPTLPDGCSILVDRASRERRESGIYVVLTGDEGLVVKRAERDGAGRWLMLSDNEDQENYPPIPWKRGDRLIGEVVWMGRTF